MVSKVILVKQYSPHPSHLDQLPSLRDTPPHPIALFYRPNIELRYHSMINESNYDYTMFQENVRQR